MTRLTRRTAIDTAQQRRGLVVMGMHRCGTSALSGVLVRLGAAAPESLMGGDANNPRGYYESAAANRFHEQLLRLVGGHWSDWTPFDFEDLAVPQVKQHVAQLGQLVDREFHQAPLFVVKDPRISRFFPVWATALQDLGIAPKPIVAFRNPLETAASLQARDGMTVARGLLIWLRHTLDAEYFSRGLPRAFVDYRDLLSDWRSVVAAASRAIDEEWPCDPEAVAAEIEEFLSTELRHHESTPPEISAADTVRVWAGKVYGALRELTSDPDGHRPRSVLDSVREELNASIARCAGFLTDPSLEGRAPGGGGADEVKAFSGLPLRSANREAALFLALTEQHDARAEQRHREELAELSFRLGSEIRRLEEEVDRANEETRLRFDELARLTHVVDEAEARAETLHRELEETRRQLPALRQELRLTAAVVADYRAIIQRVSNAKPWQWRALKRACQDALRTAGFGKPRRALRRSPLFDREWYLKNYPDVRRHGMDPGEHYLRYGAKERRDPGPLFSTSAYLARYPEVAEKDVNPLVHYLRAGRREGRTFVVSAPDNEERDARSR